MNSSGPGGNYGRPPPPGQQYMAPQQQQQQPQQPPQFRPGPPPGQPRPPYSGTPQPPQPQQQMQQPRPPYGQSPPPGGQQPSQMQSPGQFRPPPGQFRPPPGSGPVPPGPNMAAQQGQPFPNRSPMPPGQQQQGPQSMGPRPAMNAAQFGQQRPPAPGFPGAGAPGPQYGNQQRPPQQQQISQANSAQPSPAMQPSPMDGMAAGMHNMRVSETDPSPRGPRRAYPQAAQQAPQGFGRPPPLPSPPPGSGTPGFGQPAYPGQQPPANVPQFGQPTYPGGQLPQPPVPQFGQPPAQPQYPGQPGMPPPQQQQPTGYPQHNGPQTVAPEMEQRLHPDMMPNIAEVDEQDQVALDEEGIYYSSRNLPPLVNTQYTCIDDGNATPRLVRSTTTQIPLTAEMADEQFVLPLGLIIQPLAESLSNEHPVYVVDAGQDGPVRCTRCQAYMNPNVKWMSGGQKYSCNICDHVNEVPSYYFCNLDMSGRRADLESRPELRCGTVDFVATPEFCKRPPAPAAFIFAVDVSYNAIQSGMLKVFADTVKEMLELFPADGLDETQCKMGIITFDRTVHFYNLSHNITQPQMLNIADIDDIFVPLSDGFLVNPVTSKTVIESLLDQLPKIFGQSRTTESCFGAAANAALQALKGRGGRVVMFQTCLPTYGPGMLKNRDDQKLYGTDKERSLFAPQDNFYRELGEACTENGVGLDLFMFPAEYIDVASIGALSAVTGGQSYLYPGFNLERDGDKFAEELRRVITRPFGYDGIMRIRCSNGLRIANQFGNFTMRNSTDLEFGVIDSEKAIGVQIKHEAKLAEHTVASFQIALLYTTMLGQRRIRVINLALPCTPHTGMVYKFTNYETAVTLMLKGAISDTLNTPLKKVCDNLTERSAKMLAAYRVHVSKEVGVGRMVLPESCKLFPLVALGILKSRAFRAGSDISTDVRVQEMRTLRGLSAASSIAALCPLMYRIDTLSSAESKKYGQYEPALSRFVLPPRCRASCTYMDTRGVYALDTGNMLFLWVGNDAPAAVLQDLFGVNTPGEIDPTMRRLPVLQNDASERCRAFVSYVQEEQRKGAYDQLQVVRQGDPMEGQFRALLLEDATFGLPNYVDYLCLTHRRVQSIVNDMD